MSTESNTLFAIGDLVQIKPGASEWMKSHGYWLDDWPESIDGKHGIVLRDYTQFSGNDCHYGVEIEGIGGCGVHPNWLEPLGKNNQAPVDTSASGMV